MLKTRLSSFANSFIKNCSLLLFVLSLKPVFELFFGYSDVSKIVCYDKLGDGFDVRLEHNCTNRALSFPFEMPCVSAIHFFTPHIGQKASNWAIVILLNLTVLMQNLIVAQQSGDACCAS